MARITKLIGLTSDDPYILVSFIQLSQLGSCGCSVAAIVPIVNQGGLTSDEPYILVSSYTAVIARFVKLSGLTSEDPYILISFHTAVTAVALQLSWSN